MKAPLALAMLLAGVAAAQAPDAAARLAAMAPAPAAGKPGATAGATYLPVSPTTVAWGYYSAAATPVLTVKSGDTVIVDTLLTNSPTTLARNGVPDGLIETELKTVYDQVPRTERGPGGHILTGPIAVAGAQPGDTLAVHIVAIEGRINYAYNGFGRGSGFLPQDFPSSRTIIVPLDWRAGVARFAPGITLPLHPFFGSMGVAPPPAMGKVSSVPPDLMGGNMDNKDLTVGSIIFFPVWAPGALLEVGDGHAGQGDGEMDITALETSLRGTLRLELIKNTGQKYPRAETATDYISMGFDPDLTKAATLAAENMIDFLVSAKGMTREDAYMLCSVAGNVHVTELVDKNLGVHVLLPKAIFSGDGSRSLKPELLVAPPGGRGGGG